MDDSPALAEPGSTASHAFLDHTSEITLRVRAPSFPSLLAEATRGFAELVPDSTRGAPGGEARDFIVQGPDRAAVLVDWLNELIYLCEVHRWLPLEVEVEEHGAYDVRIRARGIHLAQPFVLVKAATLHNAEIREGPDGLEGEVTLDV